MHTSLTRFTTLALAAAASLTWPTFAAATPPIDQLGSFAYTCGGLASGAGFPVGSIDLGSLFAPGESVCKEDFDATMVKAKSQVSHSGPRGVGSGTAMALPGKVRVRASNNAVGDGGEVGGALAGFTDVLTIDAPGLSGTPGVVYYKVQVKGTLETHGPSGGAAFRVMAISPRVPTLGKDWGIGSDIVTPDVFLAVDETVVVAAGLVFGEQFTLTTVGWGHAGIRAQGGTGHGIVAFDNKKSFRLKGVDHITMSDGTPVTNYTLSSQAGLPW